MSVRRLQKRFKNWLIYILVRFFVNFLRFVSRAQALKVMEGMAWLGYYIAVSERRKTIRHLTMVFGSEKSPADIKAMAKEVFINIGRNATDAIRLPVVIKEGIDSIMQVHGMENMDAALAKGNGVIILTAHFGNWELLGSWLASHGYPLNVVGSPVYDSRLDEMIVSTRNFAGYKNIARGKATREIIRALRRGEIVGMLIDQDTRVEGVFVNFFGRKAHTPVGPVVLAQKLNSSIVPIFIHLRKNYIHSIECWEELALEDTGAEQRDTKVNVQKCNDVYEKVIRKHPSHWVWMHERWKKAEAVERNYGI